MRKYRGAEASNLALGQLGYYHLDTDSVTVKPTGQAVCPGAKQFIGFKNVTSGTDGLGSIGGMKIKVKCFRGTAGLHEVYLAAGDIIYGCFESVEITSVGVNCQLLAYFG
jgi:hypothetical protein